jgi:hypothetical protein
MAEQIVVYDSCIFYSFTLRNLFVQLAMMGLFRAKWSEEIHDEWISNLLQDRLGISHEKVKKIKDLIDADEYLQSLTKHGFIKSVALFEGRPGF